jgi:hypothetical protein
MTNGMTIDEYLQDEEVTKLMNSIMVKEKMVIKTVDQREKYNEFIKTLKGYVKEARVKMLNENC